MTYALCIKKSISKDALCELKDWRCEHGQSVRQLTVHNLSTKDNPGTLPINCYSFQQSDPEPIDFTCITHQERVEVSEVPQLNVNSISKGGFATIKGPLGCSVVRFSNLVYEQDLIATVQI